MALRPWCALAVPAILVLAACGGGGGGGGGPGGTECTYAIDPQGASTGPAPSSGTVAVTAAAGCTWTASSDRPWAQITSGASGSGNGTVGFDVSGNATTASRSATLTIAGKAFAIAQDGDPLAVAGVSPRSATRLETTAVTVLGSAIASGATLTLSACAGAVEYGLLGAVAAGDGTSVTGTLDANPSLVPGLYSVTVTNPSGRTASVPCAFRIVAEPRPTVTEVSPAVAFAGIPGDGVQSDALVTIRGSGFAAAPWVSFVRSNGSTWDAPFVGFVSDTEITAVVPSESGAMLPGDFHVWVTNPDFLAARWNVDGGTPGLFRVAGTPPPRIAELSPSAVELGSCLTTSIQVFGRGFDAAAKAFYALAGDVACPGGTTAREVHGGVTLCSMATSSVTPGSMTASFESCPGTGAYPIAVRNPDGQTVSFDALRITPSADGHLNQGAFATLAESLAFPRFKHGAAAAFDAAGRAFLYVAGGEDGSANVLGSVEAARLHVQGDAGPFGRSVQAAPDGTRIANDLRAAREALALVAAGRTLLAIGGSLSPTNTTSNVGATSTVERARVLGDEEIPAVQTPQVIGVVGGPGPAPAAGILPAGAWYYQVSTLGAWGEGLPSPEVVGLNVGGALHLCWSAPPAAGVTGYNVYRSLAADGRTGTTTLLARDVAGTCFDDDGTGPLAPAPARLRAAIVAGGSLAAGTYRYRVSARVPGGGGVETHASYESSLDVTVDDVTAGNAAVALRWDPVPAATSYVVRRFDPDAQEFEPIASVGTTTVTDGGLPFGASAPPRASVPPLPPGSLSRWEALEALPLKSAREGADAVAVSLDPSVSGTLAARVFVAGGRTGNLSTPLTTIESLGIKTDGSLESEWTVETATLVTARSYLSLVSTQGRADPGFRPPAPPWSGDHEFLAAVFGRDSGGNPLDSTEACAVDMAGAGHLSCGSTWTVQSATDPNGGFGAGATFSYGYLFPFYGVRSETAGFPPVLTSSAMSRYALADPLPTPPSSSILGMRQSASTSFAAARGYYRLVRAMNSVYAIGGWTAAPGPTGTIERHDE